MGKHRALNRKVTFNFRLCLEIERTSVKVQVSELTVNEEPTIVFTQEYPMF